MSSPFWFITGPPEFPELIAASKNRTKVSFAVRDLLTGVKSVIAV
jgi:hypothetical protein